MRKQRKVEKDNRGVAIYARKSRITNKGDSIGVQFKQCADYAKKELGLDEEYEFLQYEDKGLSGYFSDRPDFQRMLHDVQDGKIKAIVCYKLDRVGRKTADLIRLMDFLEITYIIFTIEEIMNLMNMGNKKVNKMLRELEEHGLIYRRHQGLGRPNKIYVYDLLKADNLNWLPKQIMFGKGSSNEKEVL